MSEGSVMVQTVLDQGALDSPFSFGSVQAGGRKADIPRLGSSRPEKPPRHFRAPQTLASQSHEQRVSTRPADSDASSRYQDAKEDLSSRTSSLGDSSVEYQDCASPVSSQSSAGASWGDQEEVWSGPPGAARHSTQKFHRGLAHGDSVFIPSPPQTDQTPNAWKIKLEDALQSKEAAESRATEAQALHASLQRRLSQLEAQECQRQREQQQAQEARQQGQEPQEQTVARVTGKIMGRVVAAHAAAHAWQAKVDRLQTRLERMGRMETAMVATRRRGDDSTWATQRRMTNTLIGVGACAGGALAAWLIVCRVQQLK